MAIVMDAAGEKYTRTTSLPAVTAFTIMGWVTISEVYDYHGFFAFGDTTGSRSVVLGTSGGGQTFKLEEGAEGAQVLGTTLSFDTWYHVTVTCAGSGANQLIGYLNGVSDVVGTIDANVTAENLVIGSDPVFGNPVLNGRMAAVKIWGAALTANEILNERHYFAPVRLTNINSWYPMVDTVVADNLIDRNGAANLTAGGTLTIGNGPPILWAPGTRNVYHAAAAAAAGRTTKNTRAWPLGTEIGMNWRGAA
jgi:hypothetical protein